MLIEELVSVLGDYFLSLNAYSNEIFNLSRRKVKFEFDWWTDTEHKPNIQKCQSVSAKKSPILFTQ